jgi:hypothetical protein
MTDASRPMYVMVASPLGQKQGTGWDRVGGADVIRSPCAKGSRHQRWHTAWRGAGWGPRPAMMTMCIPGLAASRKSPAAVRDSQAFQTCGAAAHRFRSIQDPRM